MKTLVIGRGEIGQALINVLSDYYEVKSIDKGESYDEEFEILHICIPHSKKFVGIVKDYIKKYKPRFTVIHSTVPIGTTKRFDNTVLHSPVRGKHPNIAPSLLKFTKYIGANDQTYGEVIRMYFANAQLPTKLVSGTDNTEALKLLETTYYGWAISFMQLAHKFCDKYGVNFDIVYTDQNKTYNEGYTKMGDTHFVRPVLTWNGDGIGGHCVYENALILKKMGNREISKPILKIGKPKNVNTISQA